MADFETLSRTVDDLIEGRIVATPAMGDAAALAMLARRCMALSAPSPTPAAEARLRSRLDALMDESRNGTFAWWQGWGAAGSARPLRQRLAAGALVVTLAGSTASATTGVTPAEFLTGTIDFAQSVAANLVPGGGDDSSGSADPTRASEGGSPSPVASETAAAAGTSADPQGTPGAGVASTTPSPGGTPSAGTTGTPPAAGTTASATATASTPTPASGSVPPVFPPSPTSTPTPRPGATSTPVIPVSNPPGTSTPTPPPTSSATATTSPSATASPSSTKTPKPSETPEVEDEHEDETPTPRSGS